MASTPTRVTPRSAIGRPVNQLRDPYVFVEGPRTFLADASAGEAGIAIGEFGLDR